MTISDVVGKLKKKLTDFGGTVNQGISNFQGNLQAISNPQTRNQWMGGFTSPIQTKFQDFKNNAIGAETAFKTKVVKPLYQGVTNNPISNFPATTLIPFVGPQVTQSLKSINVKPPTIGNIAGVVNPFKVYDKDTNRLFPNSPIYQLPKDSELKASVNSPKLRSKVLNGWQNVAQNSALAGLLAGPNALGYKDAPRKFSSLADKKQRFEISDRQSYLKRNAVNPSVDKGVVQLQDILQHEGLWRQYPEFKKLRVSFEDLGNAKGSFNDSTFTVSINKNMRPSEMRSTLLHEIQHAIQAREGFARGGSPEGMRENFMQAVRQLDKKGGRLPSGIQDAYSRLSGEVEARDVQARMNMSPEQRKYIQPYSSQGIPVKDQIVRMEGNGSSMSTNLTPEQVAANKKLPNILFATTKAEAEGKGPVTYKIGSEAPPWETQGTQTNNNTAGSDGVFNTPPPKQGQPPSDEFIRQMNNMNVKNKVNILDYLRTPQKVLEKIGLGQEGKDLSSSWDKYKSDLSTEINRITEWQKQVPSVESSQRLFRYLDGKTVDLTPQEQKVAGEIKTYLSDWADKLGLDKQRRISNYITHIFERGLIEKEFDPELAKIIADKVPGSVYDPFTQQRLGKLGYVENVWKALDAYVKRGTRKVNMDPALERLSSASQKLDLESWNYVKKYADRINLRPTEVDNLVDNFIKSSPIGYTFGQRPTAALTQSTRQMVYRGTLGLNLSSALRNLSQGANTYAELGERFTFKGYLDLVRNGTKELYENGVLDDGLIQDRTVNVLKNATQKMDKGLFFFFETAEKINRGSAYFGAKAKALAQGMKEPEAIQYAKNIVAKTQFKFGAIDTPLALSSDVAKTLGQFQSFNLKQAEFLLEKVAAKDIAGLIRYSLATALFINTVGKLIGMSRKDAIPFSGVATGDTKLGQTPAIKLGMDALSAITGGKDQYGQEQTTQDRLNTFSKDLIPFIPGGVQIKKTIEGIDAVKKGYSTNQSGNVQFPIDQTPSNMVRSGLFGKYNLDEAQKFYNSGNKALSEKQSELFKNAPDRFSEYSSIMSKRVENAQINSAKEKMKNESSNLMTVGQKVLIRQPNGDIKTIDMSFQPKEPTLTGNTTLDKKLISKYNSQITSKANDIVALFEAGKISSQEAEKQLTELTNIKNKYSKGKKIKVSSSLGKTKLKKIKIKQFKTKKIKFKIAKLKNISSTKSKKIKVKNISDVVKKIKLST